MDWSAKKTQKNRKNSLKILFLLMFNVKCFFLVEQKVSFPLSDISVLGSSAF